MNQKLIQSNGQSWLLVEVPEDSIRHNIKDGLLYWTEPLSDKTKQVENGKFLMLPIVDNSEWEFVGRGSDLTEIQKMSICAYIQKYVNESPIEGWRDYTYTFHAFQNVEESFISFLLHHGFKPNGVVILKVVK